MAMRLAVLTPEHLGAEQRDLYDDMVDVIDRSFGDLIARLPDGALVGPFNAWLHFPQFGRAAWALNRALWDHGVLPAEIHQMVILVTAARFGARYEIYGHEYFAMRAGLSREKVATICAGERPTDLSRAERAAYDMAAGLNRGASLPETTYQGALAQFGANGVAEIAFLVGCFSMVAVTLNAFDVSVPGRQG